MTILKVHLPLLSSHQRSKFSFTLSLVGQLKRGLVLLGKGWLEGMTLSVRNYVAYGVTRPAGGKQTHARTHTNPPIHTNHILFFVCFWSFDALLVDILGVCRIKAKVLNLCSILFYLSGGKR